MTMLLLFFACAPDVTWRCTSDGDVWGETTVTCDEWVGSGEQRMESDRQACEADVGDCECEADVPPDCAARGAND